MDRGTDDLVLLLDDEAKKTTDDEEHDGHDDLVLPWSGQPIQMTRQRRCRPTAPLGGRATRGDGGPDPDDPAKELQTGDDGPDDGGAESR